MKKYKMFALSVLLLVAVSCRTHTDQNKTFSALSSNDHVIRIDIDRLEKEEQIFLSSVFSKVTLIALETSEKSMIGNISKMTVLDSILFILDKRTKQLLIFDKKGGFMTQIGRVGRGPGEYVTISDFTVDGKNRMVYTFDPSLQQINQYDFDSHFIGSVKLDGNRVRSFNFQYSAGKLYCDAFFARSSGNNYLLRQIDFQTGEEQAVWMPPSYNKDWGYLFFYGPEPFYSRTADSPKYAPLLSDTVFCIKESGIFPYLVLKSKDLITSDYLASLKGGADEKFSALMAQSRNKIYGISNFCELQHLLIFQYRHANSSPWVFYDRTSHSARIADVAINDIVYPDRGKSIYPNMLCADTDGFYSFISLHDLPDFLNFARNGDLSPSLENLNQIKLLPDDSNPILLYYQL
jgi:hypothetical protein